MNMSKFSIACVLALALVLQSWALDSVETSVHKHHKGHHKDHHHKGKHHHHKGKHHHKHHDKPSTKTAAEEVAVKPAATKSAPAVSKAKVVDAAVPKAAVQLSRDQQLVEKMKALEARLAQKKKAQADAIENGHLLVSGPMVADFSQRFSQAVAQATGTDAKKVTVMKTAPVKDQPNVFTVDFRAPPKTVKDVEAQASDPDSKLASGNLHQFLVAKGDDEEEEEKEEKEEKKEEKKEAKPAKKARKASKAEAEGEEATPVQEKGIDIDTAMPYGDLDPFGREDTAQELTESSVTESDEMVDQLERAEVAEEKRAVFRALTRLRGAAITSFDGVARSQTGNIDEYNKVHKWRNNHPLHHLADEESDISKWAFPDNADF